MSIDWIEIWVVVCLRGCDLLILWTTDVNVALLFRKIWVDLRERCKTHRMKQLSEPRSWCTCWRCDQSAGSCSTLVPHALVSLLHLGSFCSGDLACCNCSKVVPLCLCWVLTLDSHVKCVLTCHSCSRFCRQYRQGFSQLPQWCSHGPSVQSPCTCSMTCC